MISQFESPPENEALDLVKRALSIRDPNEVLECFHTGFATPEEVVRFLQRMPEEDDPIEDMVWLSSMDANGLLIDGVLIKARAEDRFRNRLALLTPDAAGIWKIDFDAFARTTKPSWDELFQEGASEGLVRVIVKPDSYYNGPFRDDSQWECYGMVSPDTQVIMLGYCRSGSPQARAMTRIATEQAPMEGKTSPRRATLRLQRVEGSESRQFEITRVMAEDWILSDKPFDTNFE